VITFIASRMLLGDLSRTRLAFPSRPLWWVLSVIISCGTVAGALIPEFTKIFVSTTSRHVREVTNCFEARRRLAEHPVGVCGGNMSAFWMGLVILG